MPKNAYLNLNDYSDEVLQASVSYRTRAAILSFYKQNYPPRVELFILFLQHVQIISQIILYNKTVYSSQDVRWQGSMDIIYFIAKIFNPGYFIHSVKNIALLWLILIGLLIFTMLRLMIMIQILMVSMRRARKIGAIAWVWKWIFKTVQVVSFMMISFYFNTFIAFYEHEVPMAGPGFICVFLILVDFIGTINNFIRWGYMLPSKSLLATKKTTIDIIMTIQNLAMTILYVTLPVDTLLSLWILTTMYLIFSIMMSYIYIKTLPNYNIRVLFLRGYLIIIATSLSFLYLLRAFIISVSRKGFEIGSILIIWAMIAPLILKLFKIHLKGLLRSLLYKTSSQLSLELAIQKIIVMKHFLKTKRRPRENKDTNLANLLYEGMNTNVGMVFNLTKSGSLEDIELSFRDKHSRNKLIVAYLEQVMTRFPNDELLKVLIVYYYVKKLKAYGNAIRIIKSLDKTLSANVYVNVCIIRYNIQKQINRGQYQTKGEIDLNNAIKIEQIVEDLKKKILDQLDLQLQLCQEYKKKVVSLARIWDLAQLIDHHREIILSQINMTLKLASDYFIEPWLTAQYYSLVANHSVIDFVRYRRVVLKKYQRFNRIHETSQFQPENMHDADNIFILTSGYGEKRGSIVSCSKAIEDILGWDSKLIIDKSITCLIPTAFQTFLTEKMDEYFTESTKATIEYCGFLQHTTGYMREMNICFSIYPFLHQDFYLGFLARPLKSTVDYIVLSNEGKVCSFTEGIGQKLGLLCQKELHIRDISEEFYIKTLKGNSRTTRFPQNDEMVAKPEKIESFDSTGAILNHNSSNYNIPSLKVQGQQRETSLDFQLRNYLKIYEFNGSDGDIITFNEYKASRKDNQGILLPKQTFRFRCQIEHKYQTAGQAKLYSLEEVSENGAALSMSQPDLQRKPSKLEAFAESNLNMNQLAARKKSLQFNDIQIQDEEEEEDYFENENEKDGGWIEFHRISMQTPKARQSYNTIIDGYTLNSPSHSRTTNNGFLSAKSLSPLRGAFHDGETQRGPSIPLPSELLVSHEVTKDVTRKRDDGLEGFIKNPKSGSGKFSLASGHYKALNNYKKVLEATHYLKSIDVMIILFYVVMGLVIFKAIIVSVPSDTSFLNASKGKDVMVNSELQKYYLVSLQDSVNTLWYLSQQTNQSDAIAVSDRIKRDLNALAETNVALLQARLFFSKSAFQVFFNRNVTMYGSDSNGSEESSYSVNNFQAVNILIQTLQDIVSSTKDNITRAIPQLEFVTRNALNNVLMSSEASSIIIRQALDDSKISSESLSLVNQMLNACVGITLFYIIMHSLWIQYRNQKQNMTAFVRLNMKEVTQVSKKLSRFEMILKEEYPFGHERNAAHLRNFDASIKFEAEKDTVKRSSKEIDSKGLSKRLVTHLISLMFMFVVLIVSMVFNFVLLSNLISYIFTMIDQLQYIYLMKEKISLSYLALTGLALRNNTIAIHNQAIAVQLNQSINDINYYIGTVKSNFFEKDSSVYSEAIQSILFDKACFFVIDKSHGVCEGLQDEKSINLMSMLSDYSYYINSLRSDFQLSNKSTESLKQIYENSVETLNPKLQTLQSFSSLISMYLGLNYSESPKSDIIQKVFTDKIYYVILVLIIVLSWFGTFRKLREFDNNFRKVLKVFPHYLILSNFLLKKYLQRTYKGIFHSKLEGI